MTFNPAYYFSFFCACIVGILLYSELPRRKPIILRPLFSPPGYPPTEQTYGKEGGKGGKKYFSSRRSQSPSLSGKSFSLPPPFSLLNAENPSFRLLSLPLTL